jgi:hypothetical protein
VWNCKFLLLVSLGNTSFDFLPLLGLEVRSGYPRRTKLAFYPLNELIYLGFRLGNPR